MRKLTAKQKKYAVRYVKTGCKRQGVIEAYRLNSRKAADSYINWLNHCPHVQKEIDYQLEKVGLTIEQIVKRLAESIERGWGVKATHADALHGLELVLEASNNFKL